MNTENSLNDLNLAHAHAQEILSTHSHNVLPSGKAVHAAASSLIPHLPAHGYGSKQATLHLLQDIAPGLNAASLSPNYYGFVIGGVTPAARAADCIVGLYDQNVQVHLPEQTVATVVEDRALSMMIELLDFDPQVWDGRTFTTGATASNVLGLACGREFVLNNALRAAKVTGSVGELGLLEAGRKAGVDRVLVLTTMPHSSLAKAASVVGLGRASVVDVGQKYDPLAFDIEVITRNLKLANTRSIVVVSCGDINTGGFATRNFEEMRKLREICDEYGAWLHVDGAFGIYTRVLKGPEFARVIGGSAGMELADSIAGDAHKLLNVPYDCGFFISKHQNTSHLVFHNPNAAYLDVGGAGRDGIASPLNSGLENSRRFRGLPVYATLAAYGCEGYRNMLERQVQLARAVAGWLDQHEMFEILPKQVGPKSKQDDIFIIVLFRAKDEQLNRELVGRINATSKIYVSGTSWEGLPASRIAVSNWQVSVERDLDRIKTALVDVICQWQKSRSNTKPE